MPTEFATTRMPLHFTHANSFPSSTYRKFLRALEADFDVGFLDMLGHDPAYPVSDCWPNLVRESIAFIEQRYAEPVVAVGHSLGGFISFLGAIERPDLYRAVILLDSPIFSRRVSTMLWLGKRLGFIERLTPGRGSRTRRTAWANHEAAVAHFRQRSMFAGFDPECLQDYVVHGTCETADGVRLKFLPDVEYQIYCGLPHIFPSLRGRLHVPTGFIGGDRSDYVRRADLRHMQRGFGIVLQQIAGGHLFPFERPQAAAEAVKAMAARLLIDTL